MINITELVSIVVVSYNSAKFIKKTLESIINQTYKNFEIIVSDDNSKDSTIEEVIEYFNRIQYQNYKIFTSEENRGIPGNCNRAIKECSGKYIKLIAADDLLMPRCIERNVNFMKLNNNLIQFSKSQYFYEENDRVYNIENEYNLSDKINYMSAKKQFEKMAYANYIQAPTVFFHRDFFNKYGLYDERYKFIEDYPLWCKCLAMGEKMLFIDEYTIMYRQHNSSLTNSADKYINENTFIDYVNFFDDYLKSELVKRKKILIYLHKKLYISKVKKIITFGNKKDNKIVELIYKIIDPLVIYLKLKSYFVNE